ncbi:MAG: hypothetical protein RL676_619 [Pseudomonadota bacterium]
MRSTAAAGWDSAMQSQARVAALSELRVYGVDFSSAPSRKKPITIAVGTLVGDQYCMDQVVAAPDFGAFDAFLMHAGPWVAGFDLPFSMPRALIEHYGWPTTWPEFIQWYGQQDRAVLRGCFKAFCDARPAGQKYVYRQTDRPAGSSPAMRWTNPPVAWMAHAGAPRLLRAGLTLPGLCVGADPEAAQRIGLEAYPGFTARKVSTRSYKSDEVAKQTEERRHVREQLLGALIAGRAGLSVRLSASHPWRLAMVADGSGDLIDAAICALQAAHAVRQPRFGFPDRVDPLEGWIASV